MRYVFTHTEESRGEYRFAGKLDITAETAQKVESLIDHFRLFRDLSDVGALQERIVALQSETMTHTVYSEKRPVYAVDSCLDFEFTTPYKDWALCNFGYDGVFPDLEIPRKYDGLIHTNYQARLYTECEHICFKAFVSSSPWNKRDAQGHAESLIVDYIGEEFGTRRREPEFLPSRNGHYVRNPNYLKRHKATPAASNPRLKRAFFEWWLVNHANNAQCEVVAGNRQIVAETGSYMGAFNFERHESTIYYGRKLTKDGKTHDYKAMSFADFAKLGESEE